MGFQKAARKWRGREIGSRAFTEYPVRTSEIDQAFYRDYDSYICADAASRNGKTLRCRESSHDVPMGQFTWVIALTDREYETLQYATFNQIRAFVDRHDSAIKD